MVILELLENNLIGIIIGLNLVLTCTNYVGASAPLVTSLFTGILGEDVGIGNAKIAYERNHGKRKRKGEVCIIINRKTLKLRSAARKHFRSALDDVIHIGRLSAGSRRKHTLKRILYVVCSKGSTVVELDALLELTLKRDTIRLKGRNFLEQARNKLVILSPTQGCLKDGVCNGGATGRRGLLHV